MHRRALLQEAEAPSRSVHFPYTSRPRLYQVESGSLANL